MVVIIDYGMGNLGSIKNMIKKIGHSSEITNDPERIKNAKKLILPGVGKFSRAMANLDNLKLTELIKEKAVQGTPLLGICLGMQLLADDSEEGNVAGLGLIPGHVRKFNLAPEFKVPHMGWNTVDYALNCPLFAACEKFEEVRFYFVHSYQYECTDQKNVIGTTQYGKRFTSVVQAANVYGVQFHPEKSHKYGMQLLKNFIEREDVTSTSHSSIAFAK